MHIVVRMGEGRSAVKILTVNYWKETSSPGHRWVGNIWIHLEGI